MPALGVREGDLGQVVARVDVDGAREELPLPVRRVGEVALGDVLEGEAAPRRRPAQPLEARVVACQRQQHDGRRGAVEVDLRRGGGRRRVVGVEPQEPRPVERGGARGPSVPRDDDGQVVGVPLLDRDPPGDRTDDALGEADDRLDERALGQLGQRGPAEGADVRAAGHLQAARRLGAQLAQERDEARPARPLVRRRPVARAARRHLDRQPQPGREDRGDEEHAERRQDGPRREGPRRDGPCRDGARAPEGAGREHDGRDRGDAGHGGRPRPPAGAVGAGTRRDEPPEGERHRHDTGDEPEHEDHDREGHARDAGARPCARARGGTPHEERRAGDEGAPPGGARAHALSRGQDGPAQRDGDDEPRDDGEHEDADEEREQERTQGGDRLDEPVPGGRRAVRDRRLLLLRRADHGGGPRVLRVERERLLRAGLRGGPGLGLPGRRPRPAGLEGLRLGGERRGGVPRGDRRVPHVGARRGPRRRVRGGRGRRAVGVDQGERVPGA
ncbi:hypothetical protein [Cellulosimicrobium sp. TH-20]|uniref:hypothetical protein n=1 Tax=Cellulosimicrobium sp. TH-20 TaxID=1980001 RepID=UPI0018DC8DC8|nr:hypothetical protein [Cellulosimicrobium sp. TH-20]